MTISSYPFDGSGDGSSVNENQWSTMARLWAGTGVLKNELNEFAVTAVTGTNGVYSVNVASGKAWIAGHYVSSDATVTLAPTGLPSSSGRKKYLVVAAINWSTNSGEIRFSTITGSTVSNSTTPVVPALYQVANPSNPILWEIPLASFEVYPNTDNGNISSITDLRIFSPQFENGYLNNLVGVTTSGAITTTGTLTGNSVTASTNGLTVTAGGMKGQAAPKCALPAVAWTPSQTNGATIILNTTNFQKYELSFSGTADSSAEVILQCPTNYAGGSIRLWLYWYSPGTTNQVTSWRLDTKSFTSTNQANSALLTGSANGTAPADNNAIVVTSLVWSTNLPAAGSMIALRLNRLAYSDSLDVNNQPAFLQMVAVEFGY